MVGLSRSDRCPRPSPPTTRAFLAVFVGTISHKEPRLVMIDGQNLQMAARAIKS
ncbi:hypothetical protein IE4771_PB00231 (plasmid) [Rhizobium etli bv. mimosae str. IE4771]|uniref:Uncharacterized protein n=1 Tax=Rhizobium etli bv. mimosae str. IE4771 TaxID=1432050 RepID=A0A060IE38_RHIET|nr:hypothetical protein IE4771_PB00231 [Rhizobium sp. IE4771]